MLYPFKFTPAYKDYLWGGENLKKYGKGLPEGITAESWEISCHPDGLSKIANGIFAGITLDGLVKTLKHWILGNALPKEYVDKFPLLVKLIDANDSLSVQVHPDDEYAYTKENGESGKTEMWFVMEAKPDSKIVYGLKSGVKPDELEEHIRKNDLQDALGFLVVQTGDFIYIPAGMLHAIGKGLIIAEIQQTSNLTYRVYDYDRKDKDGKKRELHITKALDVIGQEQAAVGSIPKGLKVKLGNSSSKVYAVASKYFLTEIYDINEPIEEGTDGSKFYIMLCIQGEGQLIYDEGMMEIHGGDSLLLPAVLGRYRLEGHMRILKTCIPDIQKDILQPLEGVGYTIEDIRSNIQGMSELI